MTYNQMNDTPVIRGCRSLFVLILPVAEPFHGSKMHHFSPMLLCAHFGEKSPLHQFYTAWQKSGAVHQFYTA